MQQQNKQKQTDMNKVEIIEMVANHYNLGNRSTSGTGCMYRTDDGRMCAVGMCMNVAAIDKYGNYVGSISEISGKINNGAEGLDLIFKEEYRGHDVSFWDDLQSLHDYRYYWTLEGLSEDGKEKVEQLIRKYK